MYTPFFHPPPPYTVNEMGETLPSLLATIPFLFPTGLCDIISGDHGAILYSNHNELISFFCFYLSVVIVFIIVGSCYMDTPFSYMYAPNPPSPPPKYG